MRNTYREVRSRVYEEATWPSSGAAAVHQQNKATLRQQIMRVCSGAKLDLVMTSGEAARHRLWNHLWTKNRYAGIRSAIASREIADIAPVFDNYRDFCSPNWNLISKHYTVDLANSGVMVKNFFQRTGDFSGKQTIGNVPKLKKLIHVARLFAVFVKAHPQCSPLLFVTGSASPSDVWAVHEHLLALGYTADLTALHCMMDLGFEVMKPDIVISRLFLQWGWLNKIVKGLPNDLTELDLVGRGKYKSKYKYTNPNIYVPIINLSRRIVSTLSENELRRDIGWSTDNKLREFDLFMVKFGQVPEPNWGLERRLAGTIISRESSGSACRAG